MADLQFKCPSCDRPEWRCHCNDSPYIKYNDPKDGWLFIPRESIFVFGSNLAGIHGAGAAKFAVQHFEAEYGVGKGRTGRAYAVPTKHTPRIRDRLTLPEIRTHIREFVAYSREHPELNFYITKVGCGLAYYLEADIIPLFKGVNVINCQLPKGWLGRLTETTDESP